MHTHSDSGRARLQQRSRRWPRDRATDVLDQVPAAGAVTTDLQDRRAVLVHHLKTTTIPCTERGQTGILTALHPRQAVTQGTQLHGLLGQNPGLPGGQVSHAGSTSISMFEPGLPPSHVRVISMTRTR